MTEKAGRRAFGQVTKLPSGRYRARYADPYGRLTPGGEPVRHNAPHTFHVAPDPVGNTPRAIAAAERKADELSRKAAERWLDAEERLIAEGDWTPPAERKSAKSAKQLLFGEYAEAWLINRKVKGKPLADRTRDHYRDLLDRFILPTFKDRPIKAIAHDDVDHWYELTAVGKPTTQAHAYSLLRTILGTAVDRGLLPFNPAKVRGGGTTKRASKTKVATLEELAAIVAAMPERRRLMILLAAWCALRFGELAELRRGDVDTRNAVIHVRRGVVRVNVVDEDGNRHQVRKVKAPKSDAGVRDVPIPPHLIDDVCDHLKNHVAPARDALLFPGRILEGDGGRGEEIHLSSSAFYGHIAILNKDGSIRRKGDGYFEARRQAGRDDLRFHDLRHTGLTNAAVAGATLAELMQLAGHSTAGAAMRYQGVAKDRMQDLAKRMSEMAKSGS